MKIPSQLMVSMSVTCHDCNATVEVDGPMSSTTALKAAIRQRLIEHDWHPMMVGVHCLGVMCPRCLAQELDVDDNEEATDDDETFDTDWTEEESGRELAEAT